VAEMIIAAAAKRPQKIGANERAKTMT
jgi:hypothetical protein